METWYNPETGEVEDRLHLHWRLSQPSRTREEHRWLKEARRLACKLAGSDGSAVPLCHPLRWAGSVHRKGKPRVARIVGGDPEREISAGCALAVLREAAGSLPEPERVSAELVGKADDVEGALAVLPNDDLPWDEWNRIGMATWGATGGSEEGYRVFAQWSAKSAKNDPAASRKRWEHYHRSPPNRIGAGTLFYMADQYCIEHQRVVTVKVPAGVLTDMMLSGKGVSTNRKDIKVKWNTQ